MFIDLLLRILLANSPDAMNRTREAAEATMIGISIDLSLSLSFIVGSPLFTDDDDGFSLVGDGLSDGLSEGTDEGDVEGKNS